MSLRTKTWSWLRTALLGRRLEHENEQEWLFHLDAAIEALVAEGHVRAEAERIARREFGDPGRWKEESRHARGFRFLDDVRFDVRYALRQARRTPAFALAVIATLALGVATNAALFTVVNTVLLRPLPYSAPDRLVLYKACRADCRMRFPPWTAAPSCAARAWESASVWRRPS